MEGAVAGGIVRRGSTVHMLLKQEALVTVFLSFYLMYLLLH